MNKLPTENAAKLSRGTGVNKPKEQKTRPIGIFKKNV